MTRRTGYLDGVGGSRARNTCVRGTMEAVTHVGRANQTSVFHITHIENLASIIRKGGLRCDRENADRGLAKV